MNLKRKIGGTFLKKQSKSMKLSFLMIEKRFKAILNFRRWHKVLPPLATVEPIATCT